MEHGSEHFGCCKVPKVRFDGTAGSVHLLLLLSHCVALGFEAQDLSKPPVWIGLRGTLLASRCKESSTVAFLLSQHASKKLKRRVQVSPLIGEKRGFGWFVPSSDALYGPVCRSRLHVTESQ
jgi:hypothetical protein